MARGTGTVNRSDTRGLRPDAARLTHPGPVADSRAIVVPTRLTGYDIELPAGTPLLGALQNLLNETGCASANGQLVGGELREFSYYIPDLGPVGGPVANFSRPYLGQAPGQMIRGGITIGRRDGEVFCHSHSLFMDARGIQRAGHLIPEKVILGEGVRAQVWGGPDVVVEMQPDPETQMTLFTPRRVDTTGRGEEAAVVCRIRPNVDLVGVVETITEDQGWEGAHVRGQVGSLVGGQLEQLDGSVVTAAGPATEVMFLDGTVRRIDGTMTADLSAHLVDRHANVYSGRILPGQNAVAVTYELVLTEARARTGT
jgi:predicted DNA-binding protein with PD1-like motif